MHPQAKDTFVKKLIDIVGNITTILPHSDRYNLAQHNLIMLSESLALVDDVADQYEKLRDQILVKLRSGEKVSEETISKALRHLVVSLHKEGDFSMFALFSRPISGRKKFI